MYLKRLELQGFKSFASTTGFEFAPGVTCIVGPNGSGKTNVADAVRWVLGEQASRIIRARRTEDVIFSGSAKRSAVGLAEARMTLDNSDHWLPLDYEEVVVTRRAYRSGDNEYYINQSRVRLRDVTELFLKAQVGQNSYAFMGQGLVEEVLTLRPEERRNLIEEAADVRLHRTKLDEARSRLSATQDNLDRISLLVKEIEPRLRQLERQANRADLHARLSAELAGALQTLFGEQWREAQEALAAARASCDQRQEELDSAKRDVETCEEGLRSLTTAIEERRGDIAHRVESHRNLEDYRRDLQRRITMDDERQRMLVVRRDELVGGVGALRAEQEEMAGLIARQEERAQGLREQVQANSEPAEVAEEFEGLDARLNELRSQLRENEAAASGSAARRAETEARARALAEQQERLAGEMKSLQDARDGQVASLADWAREFATRRRRLADLRPTVEMTERALAEAERRLAQAAVDADRRQEEARDLTVQIESAQARLEAAQATDIELPAADAGVRALLAAGGRVTDETPEPDRHIQGMVGMLGQLLRVTSGLERAIEAALADSIHSVVVEKHEDALAAVELLVSEDLGRATVFSLADLKPSQPLNLLEERGLIGVASELVICDHRYRSLINTLLGRTIVVENLGVAKVVLRRGLGSVVTRDGILLRPQGSMTAGSARAIRQAFTHQRDLSELPRDLERLRTAHQEASAALEPSRRARAEAQQARDRLAPELESLRRDKAEAERALQRHASRLPAVASRVSAMHARCRGVQGALAEAEESLAAARSEEAAAREQTHGSESSLGRLRQEIADLTARREEVGRATAERTTQLAALKAEEDALDELRSSQSGTLARIQQEIAQREETAARLEEEIGDVKGRLEATRRELEEKSAEEEAARAELEPARRALEQIESRQREMNEELAAAQGAALSAERAQLEAEANVQLRSEELEALRARLQEEGFAPSSEDAVVPVNGGGPPDWLASDPPVAADTPATDEDVPPMRGGSQVDVVALKDRVTELRSEIRSLGPVNEEAQEDFTESRERHEYLSGQITDLTEAEASLQEAIGELEGIIKERFSATFRRVNAEFKRYFETFFGGGHAELMLTKPDERGLPGVDISAQPPRKRVRSLQMLSGGERSLTAVALLFALLQTNPSPICVLDEVDAALDEANVERFTATLRELAERTQFVIITHNRRTIEMADAIYGVSMGEDSTSSVLSLRLSDIPEK